MVHFVLYCADAREGELNSPEPPRERFCSRVQEHLHCSFVFKALESLGPINTSGNLNKWMKSQAISILRIAWVLSS